MKNLLFVLTLLISSQFAFSQISYGVKGGYTTAALITDGKRTELKEGFHIGGMAKIPFSENFSFQPALQYITKGTDVVDMNYGEIIAPANYTFNFGLMLEAGVAIAFKISDNITNGEINTLDLGGNWSIGYDFLPLTDVPIQVRWGTTLGLSDISSNFEQRNGASSLSISYLFNAEWGGGSSSSGSKKKKSKGSKRSGL